MPGRERDEHLVVAERVQLEPGGVQHGLERVLEHHGDVEAAVAQPVRRLGRLGLGEAQLDARMVRREGGDRGRDEHGARARERGEPQPPGPQPGHVVEVAGGELEPLAQRRRVPGEDVAGLGEPHAARAAEQQRGPGLALERRDRLRDRGRRVRERGGRRGHRAGRRHGVEDQQPARVEHAAELNAHARFIRWS